MNVFRQGAQMIATFYFDEAPPETDVVITLFRAGGEMFGDVVLSGSIAERVLQAGLLDAATLPIGSALAYAVFLAAKLTLPLTLTGDRDAWNPMWGSLQDRPFGLENSHGTASERADEIDG